MKRDHGNRAQGQFRTYQTAHSGDQLHHLLDHARALDRAHRRQRYELVSGEFARLDSTFHVLDVVAGRLAFAQVEPNAIAHTASEELMHRRSEVLAQNVPQRLLDAG